MMPEWDFLIVMLLLPLVHLMVGTTTADGQTHKMSNYSGDIMLGALFPFHERDPNTNSECGRLQDEGLQQLEALIFTLKKINADPKLLPGIKLGVLALDSCDSTAYALEQSLEFIKGFIARGNMINEQQFTCSDRSVPRYRDGIFDKVVGVIGGQSSAVSIQLANILRPFKVPQISYQSTSPTLSNKNKFPYFFRTVPSDINQAQAILEILKIFSWTYVSVVYSDTDYGNKGYEKLQDLASTNNICFSSPQSINVDHYSDIEYDTVIKNLMHKTNARVVVVFADKQTARNIMAAAKRKNAISRFVWIGSDAWGGRNSVVENHEEVVEGAITVSPLLHSLSGFDEYFTKLTPNTNKYNPWFQEYWEEHFQCKLRNFPPNEYNRDYRLWCASNKVISNDTGFRQAPALHFVRDAAYAFAYALHDMHKDKCGGGTIGLCPAMWKAAVETLKDYVHKVEFKDESNKSFRFLPSGDGPPRYSIINLQKAKAQGGTYIWKVVGTYSLGEENDAKLDLNKDDMKFKHQEPAFPQSYCSEPCRIGQAKLQLEGDTCCWLCTNCSQYQYLPDEYHCRDCPMGALPSESKTECIPIAEAYLNYTSPWAIGTIAFAGLGIMTTTFVGLVFWAYSDTPLIKASGRELSYLLLCGIFLSFSMTFIIVAKPSPCTCGLTRFFLGFCYTICYASILTKTNRIARIFSQRRRRPCHKPRYTSPRSQLVITAVLVSVEVIINTTWLLYDRPDVTRKYPSREENILICLGSDKPSYLVGLIYPFVLIGFCTVYAFKTRKCPDGFNEARYLTFTNYTTCVIWLAFLPLFVLSTSNVIRVVTLSFLLNLSGAVQLSCLFMPKVYIALLKPEKNTKESVMCHHNRNSSLAQTSSSLGPSTPSILVNGGLKEHRLSDCSSATASSAHNNVQAGNSSSYLSSVPNITMLLPEHSPSNALAVPALLPSTLKRHSSVEVQSKTL